jgi:hypothetical protein
VPEPLNSGYLERWIAGHTVRGIVASRAGLTSLALAIERTAKLNSRNGAHRRGTKTPASPGSGPAVVSGDLNRSITHTAIPMTGVLSTRVGPASTPHKNSNTTSGKIGEYLETGLRNGSTYLFLGPAFEQEIPGHVDVAFKAAWDANGGRL